MLTRRSSVAAKSKMLVFIPLLLVCVMFFTQNGLSQSSDSKIEIIAFKGNTFEFQKSEFRGVIKRTDPETGKEVIDSVYNDPRPLRMNGKRIYERDSLIVSPQLEGKEQAFWNQILIPAQKEFEKLPDGKYWVGLDNVVLDENGKVVYYAFDGVWAKKKNYVDISDIIKKQLEEINRTIKIKPAQLNRQNIVYWWSDLGFEEVEVKDHKATF